MSLPRLYCCSPGILRFKDDLATCMTLLELSIGIANLGQRIDLSTIMEAILAGERDPWQLAALAQPGVKAIPSAIAKSLDGNWREELLFVLRQEVELYHALSGKDRRLRSTVAHTSGVVRKRPGTARKQGLPAPRGDRNRIAN
jgi:hypothetical protein